MYYFWQSFANAFSLWTHAHTLYKPLNLTHPTLFLRSRISVRNKSAWGVNELLITCIMARSNLRRLFSFYTSSNGSHYHVTMTSHDPRMWCYECKVCFVLKLQTSSRTIPCTRAFITLRNDRHVWTGQNSLTGIDKHWVRISLVNYFFNYFFLASKMYLKCLNSGY